jgi:hypothetical protein
MKLKHPQESNHTDLSSDEEKWPKDRHADGLRRGDSFCYG